MEKSYAERRKTMENMGNKKLALLYILEILKNDTDYDHPLTQSEIAEKLRKCYGITLERKAISRNLSLLHEAGYDIGSNLKGNYLNSREFDNSELRLMIDGVLASRTITEKQAKELAERIAGLSNRYFRSHVKHIHLLSDYEKTDNKSVSYSISVIDEAIEGKRKISFDYGTFGWSADEADVITYVRHTVSPLQLVMKNQFYYLIAVNEVWRPDEPKKPVIWTFQLDLIRNPIIETDLCVDEKRLEEFKVDYDIKSLLSANPYMKVWGRKAVRASFLCDPKDLNLVVSNLGTDIRVQTVKAIKPPEDSKFKTIAVLKTAKGNQVVSLKMLKVSLKIEVNNLVEFACRYPGKIFLLSPQKAVEHQETLYHRHLALAEKIKESMEL